MAMIVAYNIERSKEKGEERGKGISYAYVVHVVHFSLH